MSHAFQVGDRVWTPRGSGEVKELLDGLPPKALVLGPVCLGGHRSVAGLRSRQVRLSNLRLVKTGRRSGCPECGRTCILYGVWTVRRPLEWERGRRLVHVPLSPPLCRRCAAAVAKTLVGLGHQGVTPPP